MSRQYDELDDALGFALKTLEAHRAKNWPETPWEIEGEQFARVGH